MLGAGTVPRELKQAVFLARRPVANGTEPPHAPTLALLAESEMVRSAAEIDAGTKN